MSTQIRKALRLKVKKSLHNWMAVANAVGDRIPMFVIGKPKNYAPLRTDGVLFEEWVQELDQKFSPKGRSLALVINNCPTHPHIEDLKSIKLFFLPPNTTSETQPIDQGVI